MAKWTLADYILQVRTRIDETDDDLFSDNEIRDYINEGLQKMALELQKEEIATMTLANTQNIDFREIFIDVNNQNITDINLRSHNFAQLRAMYLDGQKLELRMIEEVERGYDGFYFWGTSINFNKPKTGNLRVLYIKVPKILVNGTDITDVPERFQDIPVEYAIAKCKQKDGEYGLYDYSLNRFEVMKAQMKEDINKQETSTGTSVLTISDYEE